MKPIKFKGYNYEWAKGQDEYETLPAYLNLKSEGKETISCWKLTWWERLKVLFTGKIWVCQLTFGKDLQPYKLGLSFEEFYSQALLDEYEKSPIRKYPPYITNEKGEFIKNGYNGTTKRIAKKRFLKTLIKAAEGSGRKLTYEQAKTMVEKW